MERSGRGAAWLARLLGVQEVPGSNPGGPTKSTLQYQHFIPILAGSDFYMDALQQVGPRLEPRKALLVVLVIDDAR
jgi:hypothetical protein